MKKYNSGDWTTARFNSFIKGGLRSISQRWPPRFKVLNAACVGTKVNKKTGRFAKHYKCACCGHEFPAKDVVVDHIESVVPLTGFTTWDVVIERMFCEAEGLQILCKPCHKLKTAEERLQRKQNAI